MAGRALETGFIVALIQLYESADGSLGPLYSLRINLIRRYIYLQYITIQFKPDYVMITIRV